MLYSITGLTKVYDERTVLDIPFLEIEERGMYALLGPNGSGKTTLLNILAFLERPTSGRIVYHSQKIRFTRPDLHLLRRKVVMVDQFPILFSTTVYKNIEFGLKLRKINKDKRKHIIDEALEMVGMRHFKKAPAHRLSGGETQRVAIARALAVSPEIFLCDEPTASVDVENQATIINILKHIHVEKKITIIFTTHDPLQAASLSRQTLRLDHGKLTSAASENNFNAIVFKDRPDATRFRCRIRDLIELSIPVSQYSGKTGRVRVYIDPEKVMLRAPRQNKGNENRLRARVVQITEENSRVRMVVDTGVPMTVLMSGPDYRGLGLFVGDTVEMVITSEGIRIYSSPR
jgi:tungstate transport system ATP-binding protein